MSRFVALAWVPYNPANPPSQPVNVTDGKYVYYAVWDKSLGCGGAFGEIRRTVKRGKKYIELTHIEDVVAYIPVVPIPEEFRVPTVPPNAMLTAT